MEINKKIYINIKKNISVNLTWDDSYAIIKSNNLLNIIEGYFELMKY